MSADQRDPTIMKNGARWTHARIVNFLIAAGIITLPFLLLLTHRSVATLLLLGGLVCVLTPKFWTAAIDQFWHRPTLSDSLQMATFAFIGLCGWMAITSAWSPLPGRWILPTNILVPVFAAAALIWHLCRQPAVTLANLAKLFALMIGVAVVLLCFEALTGGALRALVPPEDTSWFRHKDMIALGRGTGALIPLLFPASIIVWRITGRFSIAALLFLLALLPAIKFGIAANALALMVGLGSAVLVWWRPVFFGWTLVIATLVVLVVCPLVAAAIPAADLDAQFAGQIPASTLQRFYAWQALGHAIADGLPWGHGADYARYLSLSSPVVEIDGAFGPLKIVPTHPHNVFLQLWLETGVLGVGLFALAFLSGANALFEAGFDRLTFAAIAGVFGAVLVSLLVEASIWQLWRISAIGLAASGLAIIHMTEAKKLTT